MVGLASLTTPALIAIAAVGAGLRLAHLGDVPGNPFYDAAVHTMSQSWHAFLFGALDPSGGVSVDKPPVDLWMQVVAVKLLGFNATALKLPQALAGAASVVVLFDIMRRGFGRVAGLAAAAALAVLPVSVLTARSDTMDTFMSFLLLVAAWLVVRAIERRRAVWLLAAGATIGLAFNVKLFQALLILPALALLWLAGSTLGARRTLTAAGAALLVACVVGMAWITPVALTPAADRPYPIGSTDGSIWNLVFVFNGLDRLHGRPLTTPDTLPAGSRVSAAIVRSQRLRARVVATHTGPARLFSGHFGPRIGSELFPAIAVLLATLAFTSVALLRRRRAWLRRHGPPWQALTLFIAAWLVTGFALFSVMKSFHPRYFETISPAVAAACGAGLAVLALRAGRVGRVLAALVVLATGLYVQALSRSAGSIVRYELVACVAAAVALAVLATRRRPPTLVLGAATALAVAAVLVVPASASWSVVRTRAFDAERSGSMPASWPGPIDAYLRRHRDGTRYSFASVAPAKAAPLIAARPQPVLMLTSYRSRPLISVPQLAQLVRAHEVRYFLIGRRCTSALTRATAACPATAHWAIEHGTDVTRAVGLGHKGLIYRINLCPPAGRPAPARGRGRTATRSSVPGSAPRASRASPARCVQSP